MIASNNWGRIVAFSAVVMVVSADHLFSAGSVTEADLTDVQLFASIDLTLDGLESVKSAVEDENWPKARAEWANYLRTRTNVPLFYRPYNKDRGPRKSQVPRVPDRWSSRAETAVQETVDGTYQVHSQCRYDTDILPLSYAYSVTKDPKYARAAAWLIRDFVTRFPRPTEKWDAFGDKDQETPEPWLTLNFGIRTGFSWWTSYATFLHDPEFTDDTLVMMTKSLIQQARFYSSLTNDQRDTSNWSCWEMAGLYTVGGMLPECNEASAWRKFAIDYLYDYLDWRFLPDGVFYEFSYWYEHLAFNGVLEAYERAEQFGRLDEFPADYLARAVKVFDFTMYLSPPDRTGYFYGQGHSGEDPTRLCFADNIMLRALELFPDRDDYRFIASHGTQGSKPTLTSCYFPYGGFCVMRSGWETDANYLALRAGPSGRESHAHDDAASVVLWAYGRPMLYDSLHERMNQGGAGFHSTVFIDNKTAARPNNYGQPVDAGWETSDQYDYGKAVSRVGKRPWHVRRVVFLKPDMFLVVDNMGANDTQPHTYDILWNLLSGQVAFDKSTCVVVSSDPGKPNLAIVPLSTENLEATFLRDPEKSESLRERHPAHLLRYRIHGAGEQMRATLLLPLKAGEANPVRRVVAGNDREYIVFLNDGRSISVSIDQNDDGLIRMKEDDGRGRSVTAGASPGSIPTEIHLRCQQETLPPNYEQLRMRQR
jgi:hypothetical protein